MSSSTIPPKVAPDAGIRERFDRDYVRVLGLADGLKALLNSPASVEAGGLIAARWAFASALMQHLAVKERHIYAKLELDLRPEVAAFSRRSRADLQRCFDAYTDHMQDWPTAKATAGWSVYRQRAVTVVDAFVARLRWEAKDLIAFVDTHGIDMAMPAEVTSNWVRKAFQVKSSVEQS